ncbi:uncharacterized protein LOC143275408 [Babylonia areolata]|uniref:uncharacterized protein LOC143275408 n=1 Tax=Babylonia areolata TaxID=304850 RepID=UPI003FD3B6B0
MERTVSVFISVVFVATIAGALRTCVDVQNTLMACIFSSDVAIMGERGDHQDIDELCWETSVLLECVEDARGTCPHLPILTDADFVYGVRSMETQRDIYCTTPESTPPAQKQTTLGSMLSDQAESCDPLAEMMRCNDVMADITPGDVQAMCSPGEEYLACLTNIVDHCPSYNEVLPFDLQQAIDATRDMLDRECPAVNEDGNCRELIDNAKRDCADFLTDGYGDYCGSLKTYIDCLDITLTTCPDSDLNSMLSSQYQHHCMQALPRNNQYDGRSKCPDDVETAMMECYSHVQGVDSSSDRATFCRKSKKFLRCMDELWQRCQNDSRFAVMSSGPADHVRQDIHTFCAVRDEPVRPQQRARPRHPLRKLRRPHFP